jgi:hypothetical protein
MIHYSEEFSGPEPPARIMGSEMEYTMPGMKGMMQSALNRAVVDLQIGDNLSRAVRTPLRNGGQAYIDYGDMLEIDTPECLGGHELATYEFSGHIVAKAVADRLEGSAPAFAYKRVGYAHRHLESDSAGYHENYLIAAEIGRELQSRTRVRRLMASYVASRHVWAGAGIIGGDFYMSQKADGIGMVNGTDLTRHSRKPMWNVKYENDAEMWGRLELRSTDANMSPMMTALKFDMTSLLLRLIEHGYAKSIPVFDDPIRVLRVSSRDLALSKTFRTDESSYISAVDYQRNIAWLGMELGDVVKLSKAELAAAQQVYKLCDVLLRANIKTADYQGLDQSIEWIAKHAKIAGRVGLNGFHRDNDLAVYTDLRWEELNPAGYGQKHWQKEAQTAGFGERILTKQLITPPATRAAARSRAIFSRKDEGLFVDARWNNVTVRIGNITMGEAFRDPYDAAADESLLTYL